MKEIQIKDDCYVAYYEINDGEAICLQFITPEGISDEIILLRPIALSLSKIIRKTMGKDEKKSKKQISEDAKGESEEKT